MAIKHKKKKATQPYAAAPSIVEKIREVKEEIEKILVENDMALAPIVTITGDKVISRIDVVSSKQQPIN